MTSVPTRDRLVTAAGELFGDRGYTATKVADIEQAAHLSPKSGAFYRHFSSKDAVLDAVIDQWVNDVRAVPDEISALLPLDDLNAELQVIARGSMRVLDRQRPLFLALAKDPASMPGLVERIQVDLVDRGYEQMAAWFRSQLRRRGADIEMAEGFAAVALSSLAHFHQDDALYGTPPGAVDRDAFVNAWITAWRATLDSVPTK